LVRQAWPMELSKKIQSPSFRTTGSKN
jgi:hypothetical protein